MEKLSNKLMINSEIHQVKVFILTEIVFHTVDIKMIEYSI